MRNFGNELSNDAALEQINRPGRSFLRPSIQNALGALLVVSVTSSVGLVGHLWIASSANNHRIEQHVNSAHAKHPVERDEFLQLREDFTVHASQGKLKHALIDQQLEHEHEIVQEMREFMKASGRFTAKDGKELREHLMSRMERLEREVRSCGCQPPNFRFPEMRAN